MPKNAKNLAKMDKSKLIYTLMIKQLDFVNRKIVNSVCDMLKVKKPGTLLDDKNLRT